MKVKVNGSHPYIIDIPRSTYENFYADIPFMEVIEDETKTDYKEEKKVGEKSPTSAINKEVVKVKKPTKKNVLDKVSDDILSKYNNSDKEDKNV